MTEKPENDTKETLPDAQESVVDSVVESNVLKKISRIIAVVVAGVTLIVMPINTMAKEKVKTGEVDQLSAEQQEEIIELNGLLMNFAQQKVLSD